MPQTLSGRPVSIAISTTGSVDVLVARIASSAQIRSSSVKRCFFGARSSTIDSSTRSQSASSPRSVTARTRPRVAVAVAVLELAPVDLLRERLLEGGDHRVGRVLGPAAQHDLDAGLGGDLGDTRAHDPRTDDSDTLDRHEAQVTAR